MSKSIKVKGFLKDVTGINRIMDARHEVRENASTTPDPKDFVADITKSLHPDAMRVRVTEIRESSPTSRTYRFVSEDGHIPPFQSGQYVNFRLQIGESTLTRPYSISSAPYEARPGKVNNPFFEITIRRTPNCFVPDWFFENVKVGDILDANLPFGTFYWEPLRDTKNLVALAGGSGITPFVSMAKEIASGKMGDCTLTILYGSVRTDDIVLKDELEAVAAKCDKIKVVHVISGEVTKAAEFSEDAAKITEKSSPKSQDSAKKAGGSNNSSMASKKTNANAASSGNSSADISYEQGFVTCALIEKYMGENPTFYFCGPLPMYRAVKKALEEMGVPERRFRCDVLASPADPAVLPGYPAENKGKTYRITVVRGIQEDVVEAKGEWPVAVALERAGIPVDTHCRGGACGFCRSQLLSGDIFVSPLNDGRRMMDKELGWFHPCAAWPLSDLKIKIPIL